jgi:hypothetical protein
VIQHVGGFLGELRLVLLDGGDHRLGGFFAEFLGALFDTPAKSLAV